jgi:hypothetical protein
MDPARAREELTDLLEDDLEEITHPKPRTQTASFPPVALPPPRSDAPVWAGVLGLTAFFAVAALIGAGLLLRERLRPDSDTATVAATATVTATAAPTPTPTPAPTATIAPLELADPPAPKTHAVSAPRGTGTLGTFAVGRGKTIYLDGKPVGVGGTRVKVACGKHRVSVGSGKTHTYSIPCNGSLVTVGTPDGT